MSYNPNIPAANSKRAVSQRQIRANYQAIYNCFAENHVPLASEFQGKHNVLILRDQVAVDPATTANEVAIYNKLVATVPNIFYRPNNSQTPIQLTYPSALIDPAGNTQYSFVAGPFIVYGGYIGAVTDGQVVNLTPGTSLIYVGLGTYNMKGSAIAFNLTAIPTLIAGTSFTVRYENLPGTRDIYYLAIGQ